MLLRKNSQQQSQYVVLGGSCRGATHYANGLPNQDACAFPKKCKGHRQSVAISDGHGSKIHFRSDVGASAAAAAGRATISSVFTACEAEGNSSAVAHELLTTRVPKTIYSEWKRRIDGHLLEMPLTPYEMAALTDKEELEVRRDPTIAYGCTLLAAGLGSFGAFARIGDGTIAVITASGDLMRPFKEDDSSGSEKTNSLCQKGAASLIETYHLDFSNGVPRAVILASDGYTKSFASAADTASGLLGLYQHVQAHGVEDLERNFKEMLDETSKQGSGDDISVAMIVNLETLNS